MGMWEADCRHGPGLLVTLDGIYNQGIFVQNKLSVCIPANGGSQTTVPSSFYHFYMYSDGSIYVQLSL